jgi:hypothetical protein
MLNTRSYKGETMVHQLTVLYLLTLWVLETGPSRDVFQFICLRHEIAS